MPTLLGAASFGSVFFFASIKILRKRFTTFFLRMEEDSQLEVA
jgi:hypothetical protein